MKKQVLTLALMAISLVTFGQQKFNGAVWKQIIDEYKKDSKAFFINRLSDDFRYTPPTGDYIGKSTVISWPSVTILKTEMQDEKIFASGDLGVVTGIHYQERQGEILNTKATYTFERRKGKWLFVASQQAVQPVEPFTEATWKALSEEYKNNDKAFFEKWLSADSRHLYANGSESGSDPVLARPRREILSSEMQDIKIYTSGTLAVVSGKLVTNFKGQKPDNGTHATLTFENRNGQWKYVATQFTSLAAEKFTEAKFQEMMNRVQSDTGFFKNDCHPNFTITFASGVVNNYEGMMKAGETLAGLYHRKELNVKVAQIGNTAVVTGVVDENFTRKETPNIPGPSNKYNYTYTFVNANGKWLWLAGQHTNYMEPKEEAEAAIKKVIDYEKQSISVDRDYKAFLSNYKNGKDLRFGPYKNAIIEGYDALEVAAKAAVEGNSEPSTNKSEHTDWNIKRNGNSAFVTYLQIDTTPKGKIEKRFKSDYLEKINGEWKIVDHRYFTQP